MDNVQTMVSNLKHAARNGGASIGGGEFTPAECREAAAVLDAAPELLAALEALMQHPHIQGYLPYKPHDKVMLAAVAAIKKARGE
jgi:hypothetical protein